MKNMYKVLKNNKGSVVSDILFYGFVIVFVVLPVFSVVFEQYILLLNAQAIKDAVDVTNLAAYNAMKVSDKSETKITADAEDIKNIYKTLLALNMNLNNDLTPKENSIAAGKVEIINVTVYPKGMSFPVTCPKGGTISRPSVHSIIKIPIKHTLFWNVYRFFTGTTDDGIKDYEAHIDTELPYNNPD
ncbi:hypothetical protein [Lutispora thermophila]|uniref:Flp pilus assembly protein TadG n=1 Tax=Lutispora thermophila DSM 19022 TaxID=1122184 RepID=A0A1M6JA51_9FIRM|nr:hypothetical protein [Lutispora thermophila]SHJ43553.1 hypothetical protein SAMN02745176_03551 [Lutispora thermophila DSM 19022]